VVGHCGAGLSPRKALKFATPSAPPGWRSRSTAKRLLRPNSIPGTASLKVAHIFLICSGSLLAASRHPEMAGRLSNFLVDSFHVTMAGKTKPPAAAVSSATRRFSPLMAASPD